MRTSEMIKSIYIRSEDLRGQPAMIVTISDISQEDIGGDPKWCVWFNETEKALLLNVTKIRQLEAAYGNDSDYWTGHKLRISHDPSIMFAGKPVGGLVIKCSTSTKGPAPHQRQPSVAPAPAEQGPPGWIKDGAGRWVQISDPELRHEIDTSVPETAPSAAADPEFDDDIPF